MPPEDSSFRKLAISGDCHLVFEVSSPRLSRRTRPFYKKRVPRNFHHARIPRNATMAKKVWRPPKMQANKMTNRKARSVNVEHTVGETPGDSNRFTVSPSDLEQSGAAVFPVR
jgi:hypothetical protein